MINAKYKTIVTSPDYTAGIYSGCSAKLQTNGQRMRVIADGTKWIGNTGGFCRYNRYLSIAEGRKLLREYRSAVCAQLRGDDINDGYHYITPTSILINASRGEVTA